MEEMLKMLKENNRMLKEILSILSDMNNEDKRLQDIAVNFGVGICSNIVGDRLLGLGKNNT